MIDTLIFSVILIAVFICGGMAGFAFSNARLIGREKITPGMMPEEVPMDKPSWARLKVLEDPSPFAPKEYRPEVKTPAQKPPPPPRPKQTSWPQLNPKVDVNPKVEVNPEPKPEPKPNKNLPPIDWGNNK